MKAANIVGGMLVLMGAAGCTSTEEEPRCSAVCLPTATFAVTVGEDAESVLSTQFEVCRNDECYTGSFEGVKANKRLKLTPGETWDMTQVDLFYEASHAELSVHLGWQLKVNSQEFVDGDHYTMKLLPASGEARMLIDTKVSYERYDLCGRDCLRAIVQVAAD